MSFFTRGVFETPDMIGQHELLSTAAGHFEAGRLATTLTREIRGLDAAELRSAHEAVASGRGIGKVVITRRADPRWTPARGIRCPRCRRRGLR